MLLDLSKVSSEGIDGSLYLDFIFIPDTIDVAKCCGAPCLSGG